MSFYEDIAAALDAEGIEARVNEGTLFVPITSDLELQFQEIDPTLPAANVYLAAADVDDEDEDFEAVLTAVVFSLEDAIATVSRHIATDQVITVLDDLLEGTDERLADVDFYQDALNPNLVRAYLGDVSELQVDVEVVDGQPTARARFVVFTTQADSVIDDAIAELWESDGDDILSDEDRENLFAAFSQGDALDAEEVLDLGSYTDFDRLFDVLSLAVDQSLDWEEQMFPDLEDAGELDGDEDDGDSEDDGTVDAPPAGSSAAGDATSAGATNNVE